MTVSVNSRLGGKVNSSYILLSVGIPICLAPSGSVAANGALTLGIAYATTLDGGVWTFLPAGAAYAGSVAGFYWVVMSSTNTTIGTIYNNIYVPGIDSFDIPANPTPIVAAGPGAFVGVTGDVTAASVLLPGGALGKNGLLRVELIGDNNSSATTKGYTVKLNGFGLIGTISPTTTVYTRLIGAMQNMGREDRQHWSGWFYFGSITVDLAASYSTSIDTSIDTTLTLVLSKSVDSAADWSAARSLHVEVLPS